MCTARRRGLPGPPRVGHVGPAPGDPAGTYRRDLERPSLTLPAPCSQIGAGWVAEGNRTSNRHTRVTSPLPGRFSLHFTLPRPSGEELVERSFRPRQIVSGPGGPSYK